MRKFAIGFEAPSAPSTPPWAIRPTPADASQAGSAPTNVPSVTSNADQVVAAPVKTAVPIASRDVQATIRSLQTNFGFDAERLKHLAKAIRASLNGEASSIHAALAFDRTYASSIDGSILNPANRARFLVLAMAIDHLAIVAAAATSAATTASAGRLHSNVPLEVSDAVSAFNRLIGESTAAGASAHPFEMHSLPLRTEDGAARLLYRSMARVSDEAGRLNDVDKLPQMERLIPHIEGFISELRRAGHINDNDKSLLQGAASRVRAAVGLMREFPTLSPLQYPFIAGTLSLSPESRSANAEANSAEIELLIRPLMQWHKHTTLARYTRDGHLARQARLIDRAKELKLIGPAQHQMISMKVDEHTLGSVESDDGPELPIFKSTVFWWDDKAASPDSL
ncbi:MAG: hypothetical protein JWQ11_3127 [Rhizobacter sp.]|nr:hypothetical protein [Rhizobacter sp.]